MARQFHFSITAVNGLIQEAPLKDFIQPSDIAGGVVTSVFGRVGVVVAVAGDYTAAQVTNAADLTAANTFTKGPQTIAIDDDTHKGLVIKQHSGTQSANLLDLADSSGTVLSEFDLGGNLGVRSTNFTEIVPAGGTCRFVVEAAGAGQRMGYQPNFGGFLAVTDGTRTGYVAILQASDGMALGTYSGHAVTFRLGNLSFVRLNYNSGTPQYQFASYSFPALAPTETHTVIYSSGSTAAINNVTCSQFDGAGGAASAGIGAGHVFRVNTSTTFGVLCAQTGGYWADPTHATRKGGWVVNVFDAAGTREGMRVESTGSAAQLGFFGHAVAAQQSGDIAIGLVNLGLFSAASYSGSKSPVAIYDHYADVSNSGTSETILYSDQINARLVAVGDKIVSQYGGTFSGAAASTQQLRVYVGTNGSSADTLVFDSGALSIGVAMPQWALTFNLIVENAGISGKARVTVSMTSSYATLAGDAQYTRLTTFVIASNQFVTITGTAAGAGGGSNQITASMGYGQYAPAA